MSTVTPPPFTCTSVAPELHRPLQHRLPLAAAPPDLLMAPWTSPPSERRGGRGGGLPRPHVLPGCHPHPATSTPPPPSRPHASPLASWTPRCQPPLNRRRGVGGSSHLCSNAYHAAFAIHAVGRRTAAEATVHNQCCAWPLPLRGGWGSSRGHCHRLCQPRAIERTIGTGSDRLRCEEGGEGSYRGHPSLPGALPALPQSPPRAPATTTVESGRLQPDPVS
jgi:hypothetical protein